MTTPAPAGLYDEMTFSAAPRKGAEFHAVLGEAPASLNRRLLDHVRIMAGTSNEGVILMVGPSALWLVPWVMDALQPGTRAIALVEPGCEPLAAALGQLVQDDLRLALRAQDSTSFLADMGDQKFDLIIDLDQCADVSAELDQVFAFGSVIRGCASPDSIDPKLAVGMTFSNDDDELVGLQIKPRPASLKRRGGRKNRLEGRTAGPKPPKELFEGAFPEGGPMASA